MNLRKQKLQPWGFWISCIVVTFLLMPLIGSGGSIVICIMSIAAWKVWFSKDYSVRLTSIEVWVVTIVCFYFFSALFCSAIKATKFGDTFLIWNNTGLIVGLSLLPVLRTMIDKTWIDRIVLSVAIAGIGLAVVTLVLLLLGKYNFELLSGNALILAYLAGYNAVFGVAFFLKHKNYSWLSLLGAIGSVFALIITARRGPAIAILVALVPFLVVVGFSKFRNIIILVGCIVMVGAFAGVIRGQSIFYDIRSIEPVIERLAEPFNPKLPERSLYLRFSMYADGWEAFKQSPFLGYGRQNILKAAAGHRLQSIPEYQSQHAFTHLHNAPITEVVSSGVLGLIGLIGMYLIPILVSWNGPKIIRLLGLGYSVYFFVYSLTNIGFYHDVTVFSYIFTVGILNAFSSNASMVLKQKTA